jgi:hypothetical protein
MSAHKFMTAAANSDDHQLETMIRADMLLQPVGTRQLWLRETELALDGYGGERNQALGGRVRDAIRRVGLSLGGG